MPGKEDTIEAGGSLQKKDLQTAQGCSTAQEKVAEARNDLQRDLQREPSGSETLAEAKSGLKRDLLMGLTEHCVADFISNQKGRTGRMTTFRYTSLRCFYDEIYFLLCTLFHQFLR
jgi:ribosome-interacting GTPase 1